MNDDGYIREQKALQAANEWEAHRAMSNLEEKKKSRRSWFVLVLGIGFWIWVFYMLLEHIHG